LSTGERWSLGGGAVLQSLIACGLTSNAGDVYLRETRTPQWARPRAVLAQNALTTATLAELRAILDGTTMATRVKTGAMVLAAGMNLRRARRVVVLSHTMAGYVERAVPSIGPRLFVRPVTLPLDVVGQAPGNAERERDPVAAVIASISPHKDLETTLRALGRAAADIELREVVIFGALDHPALGRRLTALARQLGLTLRVTAVGRSELLRAVSRAAVVVVPSVLESLGLALPEACVATSRVAAGDIPVHREVASRMAAAVDWFQPGDVTSACEAILAAAARQADPTPIPDDVASEWSAVVDALNGDAGS
jgi:glycosyltransferase involved in cell wall biosynthesis